ncbi:hypothetical protein DFH09DRAFT_1371796 [Mycena vulgaris]|nr:hypothetical protein DFH09DRAFT_1371796 [Mycena vulgaris]
MAEVQECTPAEDATIAPIDRLKLAVSSSPVGHDHLAHWLTQLSLEHLGERPQRAEGLESALRNALAAVSATPAQDPRLPWRTQLTGMCYAARYSAFQRLDDLEAAIQWKRKAVSLLPEGHHDLSGHLQNLAWSLADRYRKLGDLDDLSAAVETSERAVALTPEDSTDLPGHLQNLAILLDERYLRFNHWEDREAALQHRQRGVALTPPTHRDRPERLQSFALSLTKRYDHFQNPADLDAALDNIKEALALTPKDHPDLPRHLQALANCLDSRYRRFGELEDLQAATHNFELAVAATSTTNLPISETVEISTVPFTLGYRKLENLDLAGRLAKLAGAFRERFSRLGNFKDLDLSIQQIERVISLSPKDHPHLSNYHRSLAESLNTRYQQMGDLGDLETALEHARASLALIPEDLSRLPHVLGICATSLGLRHDRLRNLDDLEEALEKSQRAYDLDSQGNRLHNVATSLIRRYKRLGRLQDLDAALEKYQKSLTLVPANHPAIPIYLYNLGDAFAERYWRLKRFSDLDAEMQAKWDAVGNTPGDHPDLPSRLHSLGECWATRYISSQDRRDLEGALHCKNRALELTPNDHILRPLILQSLARSLTRKYRVTGAAEDLQAVFNNYHLSFQDTTLNPEASWRAALEWGALAQELDRKEECLQAYTLAFSLLGEILWIGNDLRTHQDATTRINIASATSNAVSACVGLGDLLLAVELLEQGLATRFQNLLQLKADMTGLPDGDAEELRRLSSQLYSGASGNSQRVAVDRQALLAKIRQIRGFESFLLPKRYEELRHASQNGPIVMLNSHNTRCDALVIFNPGFYPIHIPLSDVTLEDLIQQRRNLGEVLKWCGISTRTPESASTRLFARQERFSPKSTTDCFTDLLDWLWKHIVEPVYQSLEQNGVSGGRLWWCPTGAFTGLPFHAAAKGDDFVHSYTSTLRALMEGQNAGVGYVTPVTPPKFGLVGVTHTGPHGKFALPGVKEEARKVTAVLAQENVQVDSLLGEQATAVSVHSMLQNCAWVHLACHAKQDQVDPPRSCLQLYASQLDLGTVLSSPLPSAQFVFLAACQTAMGDAALVNESFHLAGGFLAAGFRGAIATMWAMHDSDGPPVAETVYTHLFADGRPPRPEEAARAMHVAVKQLREAGIPFERWVPFVHIGFGRELALAALAYGLRVIATARRPETLAALKEKGAKPLKLYVTASPDELKAFAHEALSIFGRVDYLINNAGFLLGGAVEENSAEENLAQFNTNFFGVINVTNTFLPHFRARKQGTIVNISSMGSILCIPGAGIYCASKAALDAITDTWAHELVDFNIRCMSIQPGSFRTSVAESSNLKIAANKIEGYQAPHDWVVGFNETAGKERGDPEIAAKTIIELISIDPGRALPMRLAMGEDSHENVKRFFAKQLEDAEMWKSVSTGTDAMA